MFRRKIWLVLVLFVLSGCGQKKETIPIREEPGRSELSAMSESETRTIWQRPSDGFPTWVDDLHQIPDKEDGFIYFVGIGLPSEYESIARDHAWESASNRIAGFLFTLVDSTKFKIQKTRNNQVIPIDSIASDLLAKHITAA